MCLYVKTSHVKKPIVAKRAIKLLSFRSNLMGNKGEGFYTPYMSNFVPVDNGWFVAKEPSQQKVEWAQDHAVYGGWLHAHKRSDLITRRCTGYPKNPGSRNYHFNAIAFDVVAIGRNNDLVCRKLYIPAFDKNADATKAWMKTQPWWNSL